MISFVVPLYNHLAESQVMLYSLLESLPAALSHEVIIVDDASTDGTRNWLAGLALSNVRVLINDQNLGYAKTNNRGVATAQGELLCLLNNDLVFEPGWLEPMLTMISSVPLRAGVVGNVHYRVVDGQLDHAGVYLSQAGAFMHKRPDPLPDRVIDKQIAVTGACVLMRRALFDEVGGFDERFINGCEDIDLCYKLRSLGLSILVSYESQIRHHVSLSRGKVSLQNERNSQMLFAKWRKEIKQDLAAVWLPLLQARSGWDKALLPGALSAEFMDSPHTAARLVAESVMCAKEAYWERELSAEFGAEAAVPGVNPFRVKSAGLYRVPGYSFYAVTDEMIFEVTGLTSARNFYVCGFKADADEARGVQVRIEVNGIQTVTHRLGKHRTINVGVIDPLWFSGVPNRVKVVFEVVDAQGSLVGVATDTVYLTHVVVDDLEVKEFL